MKLNGFTVDKFNQYDLVANTKYSICPLCSKNRKKKTEKCLMLDWDKGLGTCQHCGEVIQLHTYKSNNESKKEYKKPVWNNKTDIPEAIVKWFEERGIKQDTLIKAKITCNQEWMPQFKKEVITIQFNYFRFGELINIKYRGPKKSFKLAKDAELIFYNLDAIAHEKECYIVEGEMDALTLMQIGIYNVASVPNGATEKNLNLEYLDNCLPWFENKEKIFLCLDNDKPGENLRDELKRRLGVERCYQFDMNGQKDANDYLKTYGGEKLKQTLLQPIPFPLESIVTFDQDGDLFDDFWVNGMPDGKKIGLFSFDEVFKVDDEGRFIVVTGIPTHGKSEFVDQYVTGICIKNGWKSAYCSVENNPVRLHKAKIFRKIIGFTPEKKDIQTQKYKLIKNFLDENFFFCDFEDGNYDLDRVLEKAKELIYRKGIKVFVIDPYNKVRLKRALNKSTVDYTNEYLSTVDSFCKKYKCLIIIVAHPVKMPLNGVGIRDMPDFYSIKGGGEFYDMSPFGLCVHRNFEDKTTIVKVLKVKFQHLGVNQAEITLAYNTLNGRFVDKDLNDKWMYDNKCYLDFNNSKQQEIVINDDLNLVDNDFDLRKYEGEEIPF